MNLDFISSNHHYSTSNVRLYLTTENTDFLSCISFSFLLQATRLFGLGDEFNEDALLGKLEGMKDVIEQVNKQFKDPVNTRFSIKIQSPFAFA